jgi:hypothetical protein
MRSYRMTPPARSCLCSLLPALAPLTVRCTNNNPVEPVSAPSRDPFFAVLPASLVCASREDPDLCLLTERTARVRMALEGKRHLAGRLPMCRRQESLETATQTPPARCSYQYA